MPCPDGFQPLAQNSGQDKIFLAWGQISHRIQNDPLPEKTSSEAGIIVHRSSYSVLLYRSFTAQSSAYAVSTRSCAPAARSFNVPTPIAAVIRMAVLPSR